MKRIARFLLFFLPVVNVSCDDETTPSKSNFSESTVTVQGKAILKVLPHTQGWLSLQETIQPQYLVTQPNRELIWRNSEFQEISSYRAPENWSLIDAVVHPSGQVSAALINLDIKRNPLLEIKIVRLERGVQKAALLLQPLPLAGEPTKYFPASLDRIRLEAYEEDVYVVSRFDYNQVEASRFGFSSNQFQLKWQVLVEPDAYAGSIGIIGGGYDNFHQGDRYFFVYSGVDGQGNLYVAVPSHEDLLINHDMHFNENLMAGTDPNTYQWGVAVLTKLTSATGEREYARLEGMSNQKRLINMRVGESEVYLLGRVKTGSEPGNWDAWVLAADAATGNVKYESQVHVEEGDMFWDVEPLPDGRALAVGTKAYVQNPSGLSVSDSRFAAGIVLNEAGTKIKEIELPQGEPGRGSEAMFVKRIDANHILIAGVHNAPGTHAAVYCDGFIAVQELADY